VKYANLECSAAAKSYEAELGSQALVCWLGYERVRVVLYIEYSHGLHVCELVHKGVELELTVEVTRHLREPNQSVGRHQRDVGLELGNRKSWKSRLCDRRSRRLRDDLATRLGGGMTRACR
jgi:hypothetical protein